MADIKTHLRELSVAVTAGLLINGTALEVSTLYNSQTFWELAQSVVGKDISGAENVRSVPAYAGELRDIIQNGYRLGKAIAEHPHFHFHGGETVRWLGAQTHKGDPIDVQIGPYGFSLKEDSFILENMGLYKLLNYMTGSDYSRGLHIFTTFAGEEYDQWFAYSWAHLVADLKAHGGWTLEKKQAVSTACLSGDNVILSYDGERSRVPADITTNSQYMRYTSSRTREKVFAKWVRERLPGDPTYLELKKHCSRTAGEQVAELIRSGARSASLHRFFQVHAQAYYYAKTTAGGVTILRVPGAAEFPNTIRLKDCRCEVPDSQLNIITTFENVSTHRVLEFRNECRFSHGQFNGTPEAKMYVVRSTSLTDLYDPI